MAAVEKKERVEAEVFDQRYDLAIQRAANIQLEKALRDATSAISRLLDVSNNCSLSLPLSPTFDV